VKKRVDTPLREYTFRGRAFYRSGRRGEEHELLPIETVITVRAASLRIARQLVPSGLQLVPQVRQRRPS
jgi:hypothetical protein